MKHHTPDTENLQDGGPRTVLRRYMSTGPILGHVTIEFQLQRQPIPKWWTLSRQIRYLSSGRVEQSPEPGTQAHSDDRPF